MATNKFDLTSRSKDHVYDSIERDSLTYKEAREYFAGEWTGKFFIYSNKTDTYTKVSFDGK